MIAPIDASLIAPMASSFVQPMTFLLTNAITGKTQKYRFFPLLALPLIIKVLEKKLQ